MPLMSPGGFGVFVRMPQTEFSPLRGEYLSSNLIFI